MPRDEILALFTAHRGRLVDYASGITGERALAEDLLQEAFLRLDAAERRAPLLRPLQYLYRVVRNLALDDRRLRRRRKATTSFDAQTEERADDQPSPEAQAAGRMELRQLMAAMEELPERTRVALEMHRLSDHSLQEIAAHLGVSLGTAHALVVDGLDHCRQRLCRPR